MRLPLFELQRSRYGTGVAPKNPASRFAARVVRVPGEKPLTRWPVVRGRIYSMYWAPSLDTDLTLRKANILWPRDGFLDEENGSDDKDSIK